MTTEESSHLAIPSHQEVPSPLETPTLTEVSSNFRTPTKHEVIQHLDKVVRPRDIPALTGLSLTTVWRLERASRFPKRIQLSSGAVGWRMSQLMSWLETREEA